MTDFRSEDSLGYHVNRAARLMRQALGQRLAEHGVAIGQWAVLLFLYERDGRTQAQLSQVVAVEPPTMVRTIDRMVRDGLVERRPDPRDARAVRIVLTDRARALRPALMAAANDVNQTARDALGPAAAAQTMDHLRLLIDAFEPASDGPSDGATGPGLSG